MKKRAIALFLLGLSSTASAGFSIEDYNTSLPGWGTSWAPGSGDINGYYPSFYTGFAIRSAYPERIHVRTARGNQTRVSVILDEQTVSDYLFDLVKRYEFYREAERSRLINTSPSGSSVLPQLDYFNGVLESSRYGIIPFVTQARAGGISPEEIYGKGLSVLAELNPGRVFHIRLNLKEEFLKWKAILRANPSFRLEGYFAGNPRDAITAINSLLWGRVNFTEKPSAKILSLLSELAAEAAAEGNEEDFVLSSFEFFRLVSAGKYDFRVLGEGAKLENALQCPNANNCFLAYPEFTAIYPTGSVMNTVKDRFGNEIADFATPGLWRFLSRSHHDVDNIRSEPYYGWAPKMDFEGIGNGFHNPAVRFGSRDLTAKVKKALGVPDSHSTLWSVKRGGVSHGCLRLPLGHVWELRHIFPVESERMTRIGFFGNEPQDFDVYDIDGDGKPEVMGVEYMISYNLKGTSDMARREGADLEIGSGGKLKFYQDLYGARGVFSVDGNGNYSFSNPSVSLPSHLDFQKKKVVTRLTMNGSFPLYEQVYERDKVQLYLPFTTSGLDSPGSRPLSKRIVRLMGRVRGCAPSTDKSLCGEAAFDREAAGILKEIR